MHKLNQSASKHGDERTDMEGAALGKSGSEAAPQLQGQIARAFFSNSLVNTMEMTAAVQYILTVAQSLGYENYYKKSPKTILGIAGLFFCEKEQAQAKWINLCSVENTYLDASGKFREVSKQQ